MSAAGGGGAARCGPRLLRRFDRCGRSAACGAGASVAPPCRPWPPPLGRVQREGSRKSDVTSGVKGAPKAHRATGGGQTPPAACGRRLGSGFPSRALCKDCWGLKEM